MWIVLLLLMLFAVDAQAFSTKYPFVAGDCTTTVAPSGVSSAISSAANGAVICVTSGSAAIPSWTQHKDIAIVGPPSWGGTGTATFTGGLTWANTSAPWNGPRVSGFTFSFGGSQLFLSGLQGFRFDHNTMSQASWTICLNPIGALVGSTSAVPSEGLIDHNNMTNCRFVNDGEYQNTGGNTRWQEPLNLGTIHNVYYEDNTSTQTGATINNFTDDNVGGRYVARFNNLNNTYFEAHSIQGGGLRAQQLFEIYNNTLTLTTAYSFVRMGFFRGGTGLAFNNNYSGPNWYPNQDHFQVDNVRSIQDRTESFFAPWGYCLGPLHAQTVDPDGELDSSGYPCRDQPGTAPPDTGNTWSNFPNAPVSTNQVVPMVFWGNVTNNGAVKVGGENQGSGVVLQQILQNRDYFDDVIVSCSGATCTSGVGVGTHAQRPAACVPIQNTLKGTVAGPYFWETDTGEWNSTNGATPDGRLFKCTATNTWTLYYTPYTYPHPLQGGAAPDTTPPAAPTNLRFVP